MSKAYIFIRTVPEEIPSLEGFRKAMINRVRSLRYDYEGIYTIAADPTSSIAGFCEMADAGHLNGISTLFASINGKGKVRVEQEIRNYLSEHGFAIRFFLIKPEVLA